MVNFWFFWFYSKRKKVKAIVAAMQDIVADETATAEQKLASLSEKIADLLAVC